VENLLGYVIFFRHRQLTNVAITQFTYYRNVLPINISVTGSIGNNGKNMIKINKRS